MLYERAHESKVLPHVGYYNCFLLSIELAIMVRALKVQNLKLIAPCSSLENTSPIGH